VGEGERPDQNAYDFISANWRYYAHCVKDWPDPPSASVAP
jgi:hypothetical protein